MSIVQLKDKDVEHINGGLSALYELDTGVPSDRDMSHEVSAALQTLNAFQTAIGNIPDGNIPGVNITFTGVE